MERKAELYEKLARGELSDEEDKEKYCVDFFRKGIELEESEQPRGSDGEGASGSGAEGGSGRDDDSVMFGPKFVAAGRTAGAVDRDEHKRFVRYVLLRNI